MTFSRNAQCESGIHTGCSRTACYRITWLTPPCQSISTRYLLISSICSSSLQYAASFPFSASHGSLWFGFPSCCFDGLTIFFFFKVEEIKTYHIKRHSCTENKTTTTAKKKCCSDKLLKEKRLNSLYPTMCQTVSDGFKPQVLVYTECCVLLAPHAGGVGATLAFRLDAWCVL